MIGNLNKKVKLLLLLCVPMIGFSQDIDTARAQGIGAVVTITGVVTNGDELGPIRYIQDGTGGLGLYDPTSLVGVLRGDEITVSGTLVDFNGLMEMDPVLSKKFIKKRTALKNERHFQKRGASHLLHILA